MDPGRAALLGSLGSGCLVGMVTIGAVGIDRHMRRNDDRKAVIDQAAADLIAAVLAIHSVAQVGRSLAYGNMIQHLVRANTLGNCLLSMTQLQEHAARAHNRIRTAGDEPIIAAADGLLETTERLMAVLSMDNADAERFIGELLPDLTAQIASLRSVVRRSHGLSDVDQRRPPLAT